MNLEKLKEAKKINLLLHQFILKLSDNLSKDIDK